MVNRVLSRAKISEKIVLHLSSIHIKNCISKLPIDKLLYNTTRTIPRGAKYRDYPLAFKVPLFLKTELNS